jgi:DNA polymerase III gamma/tau subunit
LKKSDQIERLNLIANNENLKIDPSIAEYLVDVCEGDLRRSINLFQSISQLGEKLIKKEIVDDVCGIIPKVVIQNLFEIARSQKLENITSETKKFLSEGYDVMQFLTQLTEYMITLTDITSNDKSKISSYILECNRNLIDSGTPFVNLLNLLIKIRNIFAI